MGDISDEDRLKMLKGYNEIHEIQFFMNDYIEQINSVYPWLLLEKEKRDANRNFTELKDDMRELVHTDEDPEDLVALIYEARVHVEHLETRIAEEMRNTGSFRQFCTLLDQFVGQVGAPMMTLQNKEWYQTEIPNDDQPRRATAGQKRPASNDALQSRASKRRKGAVGSPVSRGTITVEELAGQNNKVSEWPKESGEWWLFECHEHPMPLGTIRAAAKHLAWSGHGLSGTFPVAAETLGIRVLRCTQSIADEHNARLDDARESNRKPPLRTNPTRASAGICLMPELDPNHSRHMPAPRRQQRAPEVDPIAIKPGDIYVVKWNKQKYFEPLMVFPFGPCGRIGWNDDAPIDSGLLGEKDKLPKCYLPRRPGEVPLWAPGYRDGEDKVSEREYPCAWFSERRFPSGLKTNFIKAKRFRNYDSNNPAILHRDRVEDFMRRRDIITPPAELRRLRRLGELTPHPSDDEDDEDDEDEEDEEGEEVEVAPEDPIDDDPGFALMSGATQSASREPTDDQQSEASDPSDDQIEYDSYHEKSKDDSDSDESEDDSDDDDTASPSPVPQPDSPILPNNGGSGNAAEEEEVDLYGDQGAGHRTQYDEAPVNQPELEAHHETGEHRDVRNRLQHRDDFYFRFTQPSPRSSRPSQDTHGLMPPPSSRASEARSPSITQPRSRAVSSNRDTPTRQGGSPQFTSLSFAIMNGGSSRTSPEPANVGDIFREYATFRPRSISSGA
ncbi:hypothetical protein FSARC_6503 [Fusarium sarcochroum]|uniref:Uncharacterized protein n=1 Tax=Fusarium sarcochroum TaxID=1208366 RepID=A0A8H4X8Y1_9HYPO|nr:hypothetical protein FSARC_6503 [Fusarium sarcochroum]